MTTDKCTPLLLAKDDMAIKQSSASMMDPSESSQTLEHKCKGDCINIAYVTEALVHLRSLFHEIITLYDPLSPLSANLDKATSFRWSSRSASTMTFLVPRRTLNTGITKSEKTKFYIGLIPERSKRLRLALARLTEVPKAQVRMNGVQTQQEKWGVGKAH